MTLFDGVLGGTLAVEGWRLVLSHLLDILLVLALVVVASSLGSRLLRVLGAPVADGGDRFFFSVAVGSGALAVAILALVSVGLARPSALAGLVLVGAWLGRGHLAELGHAAREAVFPFHSLDPPLRLLVQGSLAAVILVLVLAGSVPPTDWDSLTYHLEIPMQILRDGHLVVPLGNLHVAFVGLAHMLYLPLLAFGTTAAPALLNGAFAVLLAGAVVHFGARFFDAGAGGLAAVALWGTGSVILVASTPRVDVTVAFFLFLGQCVLLAELLGAPDWRRLMLAGVLFGFAIGLKYHALAYLAATTPLLLVLAFRRHGESQARWKGPAAFSGAVLVGVLPWAAKNWALLGDPFYPFFIGEALPPWLAEVAGGRSLPVGIEPSVLTVLDQVKAPFSVLALFLSPGGMTTEAEGAFYAISPILLLLLPGLFLLRKKGHMGWLILPPVLYLLVAILPRGVTNLRYLIPALPALTLGASVAAIHWLGRLPSARERALALTALCTVSLIPGARASWKRISAEDLWGHLAGAVSAEAYLSRAPEPGFREYFRTTREVARATAPEARILLLFEARGLYFNREVIPDNVVTNWPLAVAVGAPGSCFRESGVTHVLVNRGALNYYTSRGMDLSTLRWSEFPAVRDRCLDLVFTGQGYDLYRVRM